MKILLVLLLVCVVLTKLCTGRIHRLDLKNDTRKFFALSTFGFYKGGYLDVQLNNFRSSPNKDTLVFGFSLDKTLSDAINPYLDSHQERCILQESTLRDDEAIAVMSFTMDLKKREIHTNCSQHLKNLLIYRNTSQLPVVYVPKQAQMTDYSLLQQRTKRSSWTDTALFRSRRDTDKDIVKGDSDIDTVKSDSDKPNQASSEASDEVAKPPTDVINTEKTPKQNGMKCNDIVLPMFKGPSTDKSPGSVYSTQFIIYIPNADEEGLYNLYFHSCENYLQQETDVSVSFQIDIIENNNGNYLSAGEMPLPALYFMMAVLFFLSGCFWVFILRKSKKNDVFKIHYLMCVLVYIKSISLLFHGINYHFIQIRGVHMEAWAVLYYITHLLKGALLFITIVLIGTGWAFIKHILSEKDKKVFMIIIPLQVLANVAEIIIEESEEGEIEHTTWRTIFIFVDLLCCGAILFPVVWSIRHLQEAAQTDGKAAINLRKLKLFRHFYIMIVCYIYFTRIIVYLLRVTVPFQYEWLDEMFREMATFVFFVMTGYKFRPASNNPYFQIPQDDELEMDMVITQTGFTEGLTRLNHKRSRESTKVPEEDEEIDSAQLLREA